MWSSDTGEDNSHSNSNNKIPSSSSSSSSAILRHTTSKRKTMEEVWKDINLPALGHVSRPSTPSLSIEAPLPHKAAAASAAAGRHSFRGMILQDFLAGAFKDPPASAASGELPQLTLPPTVLSLSSSGTLRPGFDFSGFRPGPPNSNSDSGYPSHVAPAAAGGSGASDDIIASRYPAPSAALFSSKKLIDDPSCISGGDRRFKRMIKNRESAARSRARKQAYTNELELKVAHLAEENTLLKKQNEKLRLAMAAQLPKRKALQRTSTAPF
uniref:Putative bZIP transcription factor 27-like isoform X1 n=1 Tax=Cymbidium ensifolium TaxID=78740 RepID=A0A5C1YSH6_CYMEN|nr:putative bZIP transcription factor 27-like isoform X1 [Cymbidium ensifolium]